MSQAEWVYSNDLCHTVLRIIIPSQVIFVGCLRIFATRRLIAERIPSKQRENGK